MANAELEYEDEPNRPAGLKLTDVLFVLFRRRRLILATSLSAVVLAGTVYFLAPRYYESKAKLLVRYVVENSSVDRIEGQVKAPSNDSVLNSEVQILTSYDLALEVAEAIGVDRLLPKEGANAGKEAGAGAVRAGVSAELARGGNIIEVSYKNKDPELAVNVLQELVQRYFHKHLEVHRSGGAFEFVSQQSDQLKKRLAETEVELRRLKSEMGIAEITSLAENTATLNAGIRKAEEELLSAQAELAGQHARVREMEKWVDGADSKRSEGLSSQASSNKIVQYQAVVARLAQLRQTELELLARYTPENRTVRLHQEQIEEMEAQRRQMEANYPGLVATAQDAGATQRLQTELLSEKGRVVSVEARIEALRSQLRQIQELAARQSELRSRIAELERKREMDESNIKYYQASLEKARVDEALDPSKIPNINVVQKPSPAIPARTKLNKILLGLVFAGMAGSVGMAMFVDIGFDRRIRRRVELEGKLSIPVLSAIPHFPGAVEKRPQLIDGKGGKMIKPSGHWRRNPWEEDHFVRPFSVEIRDRLVLFFEANKMTHKPKLIEVSGFNHGAGASTIAAGLAAALSETGDGKVLLVDMNIGRAEIHPFFEGKPACLLSDALKNGADSVEAADQNLYLATATGAGNGKRFAPKNFYDLVPQFKASDFDYVIFDMPPISDSTAALSVARCMDKVLLVVEAEVANRDMVTRAYQDFVKTAANVTTVLNKQRASTWFESAA